VVALEEAFNIVKGGTGQAEPGNPEMYETGQRQGVFGTTPTPASGTMDIGPAKDEKSPQEKNEAARKKAKEFSQGIGNEIATDKVLQQLINEIVPEHRGHGDFLDRMMARLGPKASRSDAMNALHKVLQEERNSHRETQQLLNTGSADVPHTPNSAEQGAFGMPEGF